jgi:DeoR family transcriptional regulator, aga operon transcriptional repressor
MLIGERHRRIVTLIQKKGSITVDRLSKNFDVSKITIRADLKTLEAKGLLVRTHGGALNVSNEMIDLPVAVKETKHHEEKYLIGKSAINLIKDGQTIILDSGSTTLEIAKQIVEKPISSLTVLTNALTIATELAHQPKIQVVMLGGFLRKLSYSLVGPVAEETLEQFYADILFLGVDGFDIGYGLSTPDILEARLNRKMIKYSQKVVLVSDSSKFGKRSLSFIAGSDELDCVITDSKISPDVVNSLRNTGIEVIIV